MDLNKATKGLGIVLVITASFAILGVVGTADRTEQVIYNMPDAIYNHIKSEIGEGCTDKKIVDAYLLNHKYYDSLCIHYQNQ